MNKIWTLAAVLMCLGGAAHAAVSLEGDKDKPIEITADSLEVLQPDRTATFRGNVRAEQGAVVLTSQEMTVHYRVKDERSGGQGAVSKIEARGDVVLRTPEDTAKGAFGFYHVDKRAIQLSGDVTLIRGKNVLQGDRVDYSFETGKSLLSSAPAAEGGRVKALFVPEDADKEGE